MGNNAAATFSWWHTVKRVLFYLFIFQFVYILALRWINPPITITQLSNWVSGNGMRRDYVSASEISPYMRLAVIASEDQLFTEHYGFDWKRIQGAMAYNKRKPQKLRGGSTISQQTAKNVFLWQGRSWVRKGLEVYFTGMIELLWGKKRILEVYLNVIEMGKGVFGAEAAAQYYFGKSAKELTRREAAMIAASLPNPKRYKVKPASRYVQGRSNFILRQMMHLQSEPTVRKLIENR
ncbi:MAG: monofunctional biosynthetic peptidoglycan transglycosylase [Bacteroidetes bacterium]|nr:monofunctional biosynthetic peptidoglycan transglycosylase [Bacteroidota bacterium]